MLAPSDCAQLVMTGSRFYTTPFISELACANISVIDIPIVCTAETAPAHTNAIAIIIRKVRHFQTQEFAHVTTLVETFRASKYKPANTLANAMKARLYFEGTMSVYIS
jgi:hypothetical protein